MKKFKHKLYKIHLNNNILGVIPSLDKYCIFEKNAKLPDIVLSNNTNKIHTTENSIQLVLVLTNNCNLACNYCYEVGNNKRNTDVMPNILISGVLKKIHEKAVKANKKYVKITFFGGEPTLAYNQLIYSIETIAKLRKSAKYVIKTSIVTNGYIKEAHLHLFDEVDHITVSVDGFPSIQNNSRPTINGNPSSSIVLKTIKHIYSKYPQKLGLRITVTKSTLDLMEKVAEYFYTRFPLIPQCYEPLMISNINQEIDFSKFLNNFLRLIMKYEPLQQNIRTSLFSLKPTNNFCGINNRLVVYPNNTIASCHRGNITDANDKILKAFKIDPNISNRIIPKKNELSYEAKGNAHCKKCFISYYCNGGCPAYKVNLGLKPYSVHPYCEEIKKFYINYFIYKLKLF